MSWIEVPPTEIFQYENEKSVNLSELSIDEYYIFFTAYGPEPSTNYYLLSKAEECYHCPLTFEGNIISNVPYTRNSKWPEQWIIQNNDRTVCDVTPNVDEFGIYKFEIANNCNLETLSEPVNIYLSILTVILIYGGISAFLYGMYWLYKKYVRKITIGHEDNPDEPKKQRVKSLDTFRGISISVMILVNYGGGGYNFLDHVPWNGLYVADLVFPWFMWIMGVCIPIAIKSALRREERVVLNVLRRSAILFMLGLCLNTVRSMDTLRIFGVLQRFSICYLFVAVTHFIFTKKDYPDTKYKIFRDIILLLPQWLVVLVILTIHTALTFALDVPDCGRGYLGPGGLHESGTYFNCTGGAAGYIDKLILGDKHIYQFATSQKIYQSVAFDPEGPFGTLTSIVQVFLGVQAGTILLAFKDHKSRLIRWLIWGTATGIIAGALTSFTQEEGVIPLNKNLWSLSFVMATSSLAFFLLVILYVIIDIQGWWSGKPFLFAGMNATIMYVGHSVTSNMFPFRWGLMEPNLHFQILAQSVWGTSMWILVAYWLFRIKFFLSL